MSHDALTRVLAADPGVAPGYRHVPKQVVSGTPVERASVVLKWYEVHPDGLSVPEAVAALARKPVENGDLAAAGFGFVILHRCGADFYFLIASTWRNENELWETVWYKHGDAMTEFAPFDRPNASVPTFCIWELVPVWHEQQAWTRFLTSARDDAAAGRWFHDRYQGVAS